METVDIIHKDDNGSFKYKLSVKSLRELMTEDLLKELQRYLLKGPIREDNIENQRYKEIFINAGLICGFYFRSYNCCYGLTELGHAVLKAEK